MKNRIINIFGFVVLSFILCHQSQAKNESLPKTFFPTQMDKNFIGNDSLQIFVGPIFVKNHVEEIIIILNSKEKDQIVANCFLNTPSISSSFTLHGKLNENLQNFDLQGVNKLNDTLMLSFRIENEILIGTWNLTSSDNFSYNFIGNLNLKFKANMNKLNDTFESRKFFCNVEMLVDDNPIMQMDELEIIILNNNMYLFNCYGYHMTNKIESGLIRMTEQNSGIYTDQYNFCEMQFTFFTDRVEITDCIDSEQAKENETRYGYTYYKY